MKFFISYVFIFMISLTVSGQIKPVQVPATREGFGNTKIYPAYPNNRVSGACPANIDFENGSFTNWTCYTGRVDTSGNNNIVTVSVSGPVTNRHTIIPRTTPSALDQYGKFPINPPDGSGYAVKLGNNNNGFEAERISYTINVPANATDFSITFRYAVVFQDPGHTPWSQPRFSAKLYDVQSNTYLSCATFEYIATSNLPGFLNSSVSSSVRYKPWSSVFINLSAYAGRTLSLEFTTADCARGAHWGYAYIDVGNCNQTASVQYECPPPHSTILTGPGEFQFYNWWDSNFTTMVGTGQVLTLNPGPTTATTFWVEVVPFNGYGCRDTLQVLIAPVYPIAKAGPDASFCKGSSVPIGEPGKPGYSYQWVPATYLSNPNIATSIATPPVSTTYILTVTNDSTGCTAKDTINLTVHPAPLATFTSNLNQCLIGNSLNFNNTSSISGGNISFYWSFGDGGTSTASNPTHSYTIPGTFLVKLVITSNKGCKDSASQTVNIYSPPVAAFNINIPAQCLTGNTFTCTNTSSISSGSLLFNWSFGDGATSTQTNPVHMYSAPGIYTIKLVVTSNNGCKDSSAQAVTVHPQPIVNTRNDVTICKGDSVQLTTTGAQSYVWTPAANLSCSICSSPFASPLVKTTYIVQGRSSEACLASDTIVVSVIQPFKMTVAEDSICIIGPTSLFATGAIGYAWSPSQGLSNITIPNPVASPALTTRYRVIGYDTYGCFKDTSYVLVIVNGFPSVDLGPDLKLSTGTLQQLIPNIKNGPIVNWLWSPNTNLNCISCSTPVATIKKEITYYLTVTNIYGCRGMDSLNIKTFCENSQIFVPDAFSPDGDGINDILMVRGKGISKIKSFRIFNRWGELIFEKNNIVPNVMSDGWDGKIRGIAAPPAVYVYTAEAECDNGVTYLFKGNITLLK